MKHVTCSKIVYVCVYVCACLLSSCRPDTVCQDNMEVGLVCEFRLSYLDNDRQPQVGTIWDSITVIGLGQTEPLYNNAKWKNSLCLPMHHNEDSTLYTLLYHDRLDTICVYHTNQQEFVSMECGCTTDHILLGIRNTKHWIDSIAILNDSLNRRSVTNIQLWEITN